METLVSAASTLFNPPEELLEGIDPRSAVRLITAAADVALILDDRGVIRDVAFGSEEFVADDYSGWIGRPWVDTVTVESRAKVEELLREASADIPPRWRQVNHPSPHGADIPIRYSTIQFGRGGRIIALGRDLRAMSVLQQRLVEAQQSMEREYARLRHAETRHRLLFQIASEAVLVVDATTQRVVEANPAALALMDLSAGKLDGRSLIELFATESQVAVQALLATSRAAGRVDEQPVRLARGGEEFLVSASMFRQEIASYFLVRLRRPGQDVAEPQRSNSTLLKVIGGLPEGFVVTDLDRKILTANTAFLDLVQAASEDHVRGKSLDQWMGRSTVDLNVLIANLRDHGSVRNFPTVVRSEYGVLEDVEISAVSVINGPQPCFGFTIRGVGWRGAATPLPGREIPRSVEQLTHLVGRVPLKDLVRETTDMIERLCIEAALELTGDNRASAAEMLGLSRQSLYSKLRRYGLGDLGPDDDEA